MQRSLEQFLSDVWWGEPDVLLLDLAPGTGDMAISVAQALPNAELVVVTTPQPSASDIAVRSGLVALQVPMKVRGVVENMSYYEHKGEKLRIFGEGGGARVSEQLTHASAMKCHCSHNSHWSLNCAKPAKQAGPQS